MGNRRVWIIARPPGANREVLQSQIIDGDAATAVTRLGEGGWIAVSKQIAEERHVGVGNTLTLPTPTGEARLRIAATTTNLAWSPGVIFMSTADYSRLWATTTPTALGVEPAPDMSSSHALSRDRACRRTRERARSLDRARPRSKNRRFDERRTQPAGGDIDTAAARRDPGDGRGA